MNAPSMFGDHWLSWSWQIAWPWRLAHLMREVFVDAANRIWRGLSKPANRGITHHLRQVFQRASIPNRCQHQRGGLGGADTARRALAATFVLEKPHDVESCIARTVVMPEHRHRG